MEGVSPKTFKIFLTVGATIVGLFLVGVYLATRPSLYPQSTKSQETASLKMGSQATGTSENSASTNSDVQEKSMAVAGGKNDSASTTPKPPLVKNSQYENAQKYIQIYESDKLSGESALGRYKADEFEQNLQLSKDATIDFARNLIHDDNGLIIYHGANLLLASGKNDEAIPALAGLITSGKSETDLNGRMGYDWAHMLDGRTLIGILYEMKYYLLAHIDEYALQERDRAISFICTNICEKNSFNKELTLSALQQEEKKDYVSIESSEKLEKLMKCGGECRLETIIGVLKTEGYIVNENISLADLDVLTGRWHSKKPYPYNAFTVAKVGPDYYLSSGETNTTDPAVLLAEVKLPISPWEKLEIQGDRIKVGSSAYLFLTNNGPMWVYISLAYPSVNYRLFLEKT